MGLRVPVLTFLLFALSTGPSTAQDEGPNYFTHGPILGRLSAHGIGVWARTAKSGSFFVRYGSSQGKLDQRSKVVSTALAHDNTGWVHIKGLDADTKYYYELALPDNPGRLGRKGSFRTLPDSAEYLDRALNPKGLFNFSFEFACGNNQNPGAQHRAPRCRPSPPCSGEDRGPDIDFAILNGDWLYESQREYKPVPMAGPGRLPRSTDTAAGRPRCPHDRRRLGELQALTTRQAENLGALASRGADPSSPTDDHEMLNDIWGAGSPGLRDRRAVFRDIGARAWYDYLGLEQPDRLQAAASTSARRPATESRERRPDRGSDEADFTKLDLNRRR